MWGPRCVVPGHYSPGPYWSSITNHKPASLFHIEIKPNSEPGPSPRRATSGQRKTANAAKIKHKLLCGNQSWFKWQDSRHLHTLSRNKMFFCPFLSVSNDSLYYYFSDSFLFIGNEISIQQVPSSKVKIRCMSELEIFLFEARQILIVNLWPD